jgi:membrane associated rhomboid family serine protease
MHINHKPIVTFVLCILTISISFYVAYQISGSIWGKSKITALANFGGLTLDGIKNFEVWRLVTSQFIHVHQKHMIYNVFSILFLGLIIERKVGPKYMLFVWFLAGSIGTVFSTQFSSPPWDVGTGASQAAFGLIGFSCVLVVSKIKYRYLLMIAIAFSLIPALYLDIKSVGYPKAGHSVSFVIGCLLAVHYFYRIKLQKCNLGTQNTKKKYMGD